MTDLSKLSNAELQALYQQAAPQPSAAGMTDDELQAAQRAANAPTVERLFGHNKGNKEAPALLYQMGRGVPIVGGMIDERPELEAELNKMPGMKTTAGIAGSVAAMGPLAATAAGAKVLGLTGGMPARIMKGIISGGAIGGADAAVRGEDVTKGAAIGGLAGGAAAPVASAVGGVVSRVANAVMPGRFSQAPSREALKQAGSEGFEQARAMGLDVKPAALQSWGQEARAALNAQGIDDTLAPATFKILSKLDDAPAGSVASVENLETLRRTLGTAAGSADATERMAASRAKAALDQFMDGLPTSGNVISGDASRVTKALADARGNYAAAERAATVDRKLLQAELRASAANSGQNVANSARQRITDILVNRRESAGFSPAEMEAMESVVRGTRTGNAARYLSNLMGGGGGIGAAVTAGGGAAILGPAGALIPVGGAALRKVADASTHRQLDKLSEVIRSRSPLAESGDFKSVGKEKQEALERIIQVLMAQGVSSPVRQMVPVP